MYLHVGNNYVVRCDEIIGIFDIRNTALLRIKDTEPGHTLKH